MKLFSAAQIRDWDAYTIEQEGIESIDLMERAAGAVVDWLVINGYLNKQAVIFCGSGNNGGDGLVVARFLSCMGKKVKVFVLPGGKQSDDFSLSLERLLPYCEITTLGSATDFPIIDGNDIIIECLFGTGVNRAIEGLAAELIAYVNLQGTTILSVDMPAGLSADQSSIGNPCIRATHTLTFQAPKLALLLPENSGNTGTVHVLDIGLASSFFKSQDTRFELVDLNMAAEIYKPAVTFAHKGSHGYALLVAGSYGKMGAAVMAATACLRTGAGLLTCHAPSIGYPILQTTIPEAMMVADHGEHIITSVTADVDKYHVVCAGPGLGTAHQTAQALQKLIASCKLPMVLDADALNILAENPHSLSLLPPDTILTPHPKEFERLFGKSNNDFERLEKALEQASKLNCIIILKGHKTFIALPDGKGYFNTTGNAGMAKGGSGDVLSGIITGLLARKYTPSKAALLGVFLHGLAGDLASEKYGQESMLPTDLTTMIGNAYMLIAASKEGE